MFLEQAASLKHPPPVQKLTSQTISINLKHFFSFKLRPFHFIFVITSWAARYDKRCELNRFQDHMLEHLCSLVGTSEADSEPRSPVWGMWVT